MGDRMGNSMGHGLETECGTERGCCWEVMGEGSAEAVLHIQSTHRGAICMLETAKPEHKSPLTIPTICYLSNQSERPHCNSPKIERVSVRTSKDGM